MKILNRYIFLLGLPLLAVSSSCTSDGFIMGNKYLDSDLRTVVIDTCTVKMSTVLIDSVQTSSKNMVLFGGYKDNVIGETQCEAYISFEAPPETSFPESVTIRFDSLNLSFGLNNTFLGDTSGVHYFDVYRLDTAITLPDKNAFYSTSTEDYTTKLASFTVKSKNFISEKVSVRLPDTIGSYMLDKIVDGDENFVGSFEDFLRYFRGLAITASPGNNNEILGAHLNDTSMALTIHYHYSTFERHTGSIEIKYNPQRSYYGVRHIDRSGSRFENLLNRETPSGNTLNSVLIQALTASYVKIEFPYLNNLLELGDYGAVLTASLYVYPVRGTYSTAVPLPGELTMLVSDENDVSVSAITNYSGDRLQTGDLVQDNLFNVDTYYTYDITAFLKDQLGAFGINRRNLQLMVPQDNLSVTLNTLVAGDASEPGKGTRLKITYLIYNGK